MKKLFLIVLITCFSIFLSGCGGGDNDYENNKKEEEAYKKQEEYNKTPEGQAELKKQAEAQKKKDEEAAYREKLKKELEWRERYDRNKLGTLLETANQKIVDAILKYEDQPEGEIQEIFKIGSDMAVYNGGTNATFVLENNVYATELWTYHWNGGSGAPAGTIALVDENGTQYGPWQAELYNNVYWVAKPNQTILAGNYIVFDSDPATWAQNEESHGQGMCWMNGIKY